MFDDLVRIGPHGEVLARSTRLLAPVALHLVPPLGLGLGPTFGSGLRGLGLMLRRVGRRRKRRVLRSPVQPLGELGDRAGQAFDLDGLGRGQLPQGFDLRLETLAILFRHA